MQILSHILAITILVVVSFLSIQVINENGCIEEKSYLTYFQLQRGLNSTTRPLKKSISCEYQGFLQRKVSIKQEDAHYKIDYRSSRYKYDFRQKLVPKNRITKSKGQ
ncbi:hypothetical protein [Bacteriovorax sp. Seq25_V]|uniref:hypothetical protein n=1 Tax=Bacteriovorax sp. Seq25_V TaxID=1201288 RepID=UPI00038A0B0F|nr:hypothetical protein [Bacteriovorax sp. Seq25_V]EQC46523.1 hypothetical protein M900_2401 [Bacteriovorax sp. Seq25_V]